MRYHAAKRLVKGAGLGRIDVCVLDVVQDCDWVQSRLIWNLGGVKFVYRL